MYSLFFWLSIFSFFFLGCSKIVLKEDHSIPSTIAKRIDCNLEWSRDKCSNEKITEFINSLVLEELTPEKAIQIALFNNRNIQATFEELGIARANLIEAGLLSNPFFEIEFRYPFVRGLKTNIEYLITSSLLDLFLIPLRNRLANTEYHQAKMRISHEIINVFFDIRETYYEWVAKLKNEQCRHAILNLTNILFKIAAQQFEAGNINQLDFDRAQNGIFDAELKYIQSKSESIAVQEKLIQLLGFSEDICLILPENFSRIQQPPLDLCELERTALEERLDLKEANLEVVRLSQLLGLKNPWIYTDLNGGLSGKRETDGNQLLGPAFSGRLPLFNYGQAARMRLWSQLKKAIKHLEGMQVKVLSEVRESFSLLRIFSQLTYDYEKHLLPMQKKISEKTEGLYNVMGLGIEKLLESKKEEITLEQQYIENLMKYFIAQVKLDRALGGYLFKLICENISEDSYEQANL